MAKETVIATSYIKHGEAVVIYQGMARPVYEGEFWKGQTVQALEDIPKSATAMYDPANQTLKLKQV